MKLFFGLLFAVAVYANCPGAGCNFGCVQANTDCTTTCDPTKPYFGYKTCKCKTGFTGPSCATIQKGYFVNAGNAQKCTCTGTNQNGACDSATGACACTPGYATNGGTVCGSCAAGFASKPGTPVITCVECSVQFPNCASCANGQCTTCAPGSNTNPPNCDTCTAGFTRATPTGACFIKCTDFCGTSAIVSGVTANPTCSYAAATGVTCLTCGDSAADPAQQCKTCKPKSYKGQKEYVVPGSGVPARLSAQPKCWDCKCGTSNGVAVAGTCKWAQNTRLCDCKPGYTQNTADGKIDGLCGMCSTGYYKSSAAGAPVTCTKCPAKCTTCSSATVCTACSFGFASKTGSCDACSNGFKQTGTDPSHTCAGATPTTIKFTPSTAGPYESVAGTSTVVGDVEVTSAVDTPVDFKKLKITSQGEKGWVLPEIKQEVTGGKAKITVKFRCDSVLCNPQSLFFSYTDSAGYTASVTQAVQLKSGTTGPAPTFVFCQESKEMKHARYLAMTEAGKELEFQTIAAPSDPGFTLTTKVTKKINGGAAVDVPAADYKTSVFGSLTYFIMSPSLELGTNEFTVEVKDSQTAAQSKTCTWTIKTSDSIKPDLTCWDIPSLPASQGNAFAKVKLPLPLCEDGNTNKCDIKNAAGTALTAPVEENFYIGTNTIKRTASDASDNKADCEFTVTVEDKEKPTCTVGTPVTVSVPALSGTTFRKENDCPHVKFEVTFVATDNSLVAVPAGTTVQGTAPTGKSIRARPAKDCKCAGDVGTFKCAKQECIKNYDCTLATVAPIDISTTICDDADNCQDSDDCKVKVEFTDAEDAGKPNVAAACTALGSTVETDVDKATFASSTLRIANLQQDGFVFDSAGGKVTCSVDGLEADVPVGVRASKLKCTDLRTNTAECDFTLTVVDRQIPSFGDDIQNNVCGKELGPFDGGSGPELDWTAVKDNAALKAAGSLKFSVNGDDKTTFPAKNAWDSNYYYVKATLTDKADNIAFCSFSFRVKATASPSVVYTKPKIEKPVKQKTVKPTKFPTAKPTGNAQLNPKSCKSRCAKDGQTKQIQGARFECSCQRDVCVPQSSTKPGVKCCKDINKYCKNPNKCTAAKCGGSVGTGFSKCYCDLNCAAKNDCCPGFKFANTCCGGKQKKPSCVGKCGNADAQFSCIDGSSCYCDHTCLSVGDCCSDYEKKC